MVLMGVDGCRWVLMGVAVVIIEFSPRGAVEKSNIVDLLISQMESYTADLERMVEEKTLAFQEEKTKADALLNQILPS